MVFGIDQIGKYRKTAIAGSFYPGNADGLKTQIHGFLDSTTVKIEGKEIKALIVPHAGYIYSGLTAAWGYKQLTANHQPRTMNYKHFTLIGPSHNYYLQDLVTNGYGCWETPLGQVLHQKAVKSDDGINVYNDAFIPEHCLEVQLPFLQMLFNKFSFTAFLTGVDIEYKKYAEYFNDNYLSSIFIISSDLSHYLPLKNAEIKDKNTIGAILDLNTDYFCNNENTACGSGGMLIIMEMARINNWKPELIYYDNSYTVSGDVSGVVGYAAVAFVQ